MEKRIKQIGYKMLNSAWSEFGEEYKVGKTYTSDGEVKVYGSGISFFYTLSECVEYGKIQYSGSGWIETINSIIVEILIMGDILGPYGDEPKRASTNKIKILRKLKFEDAQTLLSTMGRNYLPTLEGSNNVGENVRYLNTDPLDECDDAENTNDEKLGYVKVFDKPCLLEEWQSAKKPPFISFNTNGRTREEAWIASYEGILCLEDELRLLFNLPNFNINVFKDISGIDLIEEYEYWWCKEEESQYGS